MALSAHYVGHIKMDKLTGWICFRSGWESNLGPVRLEACVLLMTKPCFCLCDSVGI